MDPVTEAVLASILDSLAAIREAVRDLDAEGLNWRPGPEANSIAAQVAHALGATKFWTQAAASPAADRRAFLAEREAAFNFGADRFALLQMVDTAEPELGRLVRAAAANDLAEERDWPGVWERGPVTVAWCLVHAAGHLREHVGSLQLTRQLWSQHRQLQQPLQGR